MNFLFFLNSAALGVGLAMDAFSVSIANGLREPGMRRRRMTQIALVYSVFQFAMPLIGWLCVHTIVNTFTAFQSFIPWIALILLGYIGGKMLLEGIRGGEKETGGGESELSQESQSLPTIGWGTLMIQGIATSIDALSVGFTISDYKAGDALLCCLIIAVITFLICMAGLLFGRKFGEKLADRATVFGGVILILIGIEIFVQGVL